jgi:hypothetical protein
MWSQTLFAIIRKGVLAFFCFNFHGLVEEVIKNGKGTQDDESQNALVTGGIFVSGFPAYSRMPADSLGE